MGTEFVKELLKEKNVDEIWLIARRKERLEAMVESYGQKLRAFALDLTEMTSFEQLSASLEKEQPGIAYLVNAAGAGRMGHVETIDYDAHGFVLDINVRALTCMSRICIPYMKKEGHIIQLCSGSAFLPQPGFASYAASKSYVLSFSRALRQELKDRNISVTVVCPGPVNTEFFQAAGTEVHPSKKRFMAEAEDVVKKAMKDAKAGSELSVYGMSMKLLHLAGKLLPVKLILAAANRFLSET